MFAAGQVVRYLFGHLPNQVSYKQEPHCNYKFASVSSHTIFFTEGQVVRYLFLASAKTKCPTNAEAWMVEQSL